jgi:hypothetical protein
MGVQVLKKRDTKPVLLVTLKNPDGTVHDLTGLGADSVKLHIKLVGGTVLTRTMTIESPATAGQVSYAWDATDWDAGGLVSGVHKMEYESTEERLTFPNKEDDNDTLYISDDIAQG